MSSGPNDRDYATLYQQKIEQHEYTKAERDRLERELAEMRAKTMEVKDAWERMTEHPADCECAGSGGIYSEWGRWIDCPHCESRNIDRMDKAMDRISAPVDCVRVAKIDVTRRDGYGLGEMLSDNKWTTADDVYVVLVRAKGVE